MTGKYSHGQWKGRSDENISAIFDDDLLAMGQEISTDILGHGARNGSHGAHTRLLTGLHHRLYNWRCIGVKGKGNWIRTPGARNPGQYIEIYEPLRVGETIHIKMSPYDRYIKRKKYYLKYKTDFYNQDNVKKAMWIVELILPKTKSDIKKFVEGIRAVEA